MEFEKKKIIHQINHLNLGQKNRSKLMMNHEEQITKLGNKRWYRSNFKYFTKFDW